MVSPKAEINDEKRKLFREIEETHEHFFITGRAGTGKSHLLKYLYQNTHKRAVIVAPTGVSAINVGGQTIHSLFSLPPTFIDVDNFHSNRKVSKVLSDIDTLIIDEVSMVRADLMDAIDLRLRQTKRRKQAFGGVQVIMFGDLYQLPPIVSDATLYDFLIARYGGIHFFNSEVWTTNNLNIRELKEVFRQTDDGFKTLLDSIRDGQVTPEGLKLLNSRCQPHDPNQQHIYLSATNAKAHTINMSRLAMLSTEECLYHASVRGQLEAGSYPTDEVLRLKQGAQVMMLRNDPDRRWTNGTLAVISKIRPGLVEVEIAGEKHEVTPVTWPKIKYVYDQGSQTIKEETISSFTQYPLKLAWAVTIHKSQGQTFDQIVIDLGSGAFTTGQTYVALSRCTTLGGIYLARPINPRDIQVDSAVTSFFQQDHSQPNRQVSLDW
jgi:ATP-dependent DNA helicase PIF1